MSTLQKYVLKEVIKTFLPAFLVLVFIMTFGFCVQLLNEGLDVVRLRGLPQFMLALSVPVVMPSAFLTAVIMAFGRLSADVEITAMRASGVHLGHVIVPVCAVALALSGLAAYFHLQVVPTASMRMEELKDEAVKQILIDQVALSAQRHLSYDPWYIQYDDFRDGEMVNLLVINATEGIPRNVITARTGRLELDPERSEDIRVTLEHCTIFPQGSQEIGRREPTHADEVLLAVQVARSKEDIQGRIKHQPWSLLKKHLRGLGEEVAKHEHQFSNPSQKHDEIRKERQRIDIKIAQKQQDMEANGDRIKKKGDDSLLQQASIGFRKEEVKSLGERVRVQQDSLVATSEEIGRLQEEANVSSNYDRLVQLQRRYDEARDEISNLKSAIAAAEAQIRNSEARIRDNERDAGEAQEEIVDYQREVESLGAQRDRIAEREGVAAAQDDLRSGWIRIHKRLAQALALLTFALVGIPLGIMTRRRSVVVAFAISFAIVLGLFYPLLMFGQIISEAGILPVGIAMWSGNGITLVIGSVLLCHVLRQ